MENLSTTSYHIHLLLWITWVYQYRYLSLHILFGFAQRCRIQMRIKVRPTTDSENMQVLTLYQATKQRGSVRFKQFSSNSNTYKFLRCMMKFQWCSSASGTGNNISTGWNSSTHIESASKLNQDINVTFLCYRMYNIWYRNKKAADCWYGMHSSVSNKKNCAAKIPAPSRTTTRWPSNSKCGRFFL